MRYWMNNKNYRKKKKKIWHCMRESPKRNKNENVRKLFTEKKRGIHKQPIKLYNTRVLIFQQKKSELIIPIHDISLRQFIFSFHQKFLWKHSFHLWSSNFSLSLNVFLRYADKYWCRCRMYGRNLARFSLQTILRWKLFQGRSQEGKMC